MSTAPRRWSLLDLEFSVEPSVWGRRRSLELRLFRHSGRSNPSQRHTAKASIRHEVFEEAAVVNSVRSTIGARNGQ